MITPETIKNCTVSNFSLLVARALGVAALAAVATAQGAFAQAIGYAWNSDPFATGTYKPVQTYAFDSAKSGGVTITHNSVGSYTVHFKKMGDGLQSNVQVGGYGSTDICATDYWGSGNGVDVDVSVACHDLSNNSTDSYFTVLYQARTKLAGKDTLGFVWASEPTETSTYNADAFYSFNSKAGVNTITRTGQGNYVVEMPNIAGQPNGDLNPYVGSTLVSAYGSTALCRSIVQGHNVTYEEITINCWDLVAQQSVDSNFTVAYSYKTLIGAGKKTMAGAYVRGTKPTVNYAYSPPSSLQLNSFGTGAIQIKRTGIGTYAVTIPGAPAYATSMAMANLGESDNHVPANGSACNVAGWDIANSTIAVMCFGPTGTPEDAVFDLTYLTSAVQ